MIYGIIRYYFEQTQESILLLAFTNRAADEICSSLKRIHPRLPFLRYGAHGSSEHTDRLTANVFEGKSLPTITGLIERTRFVVCTVAAVLSNPEIYELKKFSAVVIDEASQLTEPQVIGILARTPKSILIGDEKQLPSVVTQRNISTAIEDDILRDLGITDVRNSLFERLLHRCQAQSWDHAFGMITAQGRMHTDVQAFSNQQFYDGKLRTLGKHQHTTELPFAQLHEKAFEHPLEKFLNSSRMCIVPTEREQHNKMHHREAAYAVEIVLALQRLYGQSFTPETVGIITPFRAQIALISDYLPEELHSMVSIDTVERYQGSEREHIIISMAVNYEPLLSSVQSLSTDGSVDKKLNVVLTRAKQQTIILGVPEILNQAPHYNALFSCVKEHGTYALAENVFSYGEW
jgi:DNA replication ATP-dependent helicase Dna2